MDILEDMLKALYNYYNFDLDLSIIKGHDCLKVLTHFQHFCHEASTHH